MPNAIVQRVRLRSTSAPPPKRPAPVPTPKAPDRPASLPECSSTRTISTTDRKIWRMLRTSSTQAERSSALRRSPPLERVQLLEDGDRLGTQLAVGRAVVALG